MIKKQLCINNSNEPCFYHCHGLVCHLQYCALPTKPQIDKNTNKCIDLKEPQTKKLSLFV